MLGYSAAQIRAAEAPLLARGEPLMARASAALAAVVTSLLPGSGPRPWRVLILAGSGNNGGDALFAGALLASEPTAASVEVIAVGERIHSAGLAAATSAGATVLAAPGCAGQQLRAAAASAGGADVVLDGILGTGSAGRAAVTGRAREVVAGVRDALDRAGEAIVVAVDLPSGLDPDTGIASDPVLAAAVTVTFGAAKAGLLLRDGPACCGEVRVVDIGLGPQLADVVPIVDR